MKIIEKITLIIYSNLMLIASVIICLVIFRWLDIDVVLSLLRNLMMSEISSKIISQLDKIKE